MASSKMFISLLLLLTVLHLPRSTMAAKVCENVECGEGKCVASKHSSLGFVCKCHAGWLQSAITGDTDGNDFLPCVYPNCTLDLTCASSRSPFPAPTESPPADSGHILDPCLWASCEKGTCMMKSSFTWTCNCFNGFHNVNHNLAFPCFAPCELGKDCARVGATL